MTSWPKIVASKPLFQNTFILTRSRVVIFADIIKIVTSFIKTIFKDSKKVKKKKKKKLSTKIQFISVYLDIAKFTDFR